MLELKNVALQGALETFSGIGMMAGPAVGGALYSVRYDFVSPGTLFTKHP